MGRVGELWADAGLHIDKASFSEYSSLLKQSEGQIGEMSSVMQTGLAAAFTAPAAAVAGIAAYGATIAASYEDAIITLRTLYGSQEAAQEKFEWLSDFAATTPFEFPELLEAATRLKAYGMDVEDYGRTLGDTAAAMGKPIMDVVEAIADAQQGEFERMKEFGIKAVEITKSNYQQLGASIEDAGKTALTYMDQNGKQQIAVVDRNNKEMITSTIQSIWNDKYAGAMEERSKSFNGMISTIKDSLKAGLAEMAGFDMKTASIEGASLLGVLKSLAEGALVLSDKFANMSEPMQTFVLVATLGGAAALALGAGFVAATAAGITATGVMAALGVAVNTVIWPATLIVGTLALVAAGLVYLDQKTGVVTYSWNLMKDIFTIVASGIMNDASILWNYIVLAMDGIKSAIADMFPPGFLEGVNSVVGGIISQFTSMGSNVHTQAEGIRNDNTNIGTSAQVAGGQVTTATGQMQNGFVNAGMSALGMGTNTLTATNQMVGGFGAAGGAAVGMGGNIAGTVPAVNSLTGAAGSGTAANQKYAASFIDVSKQANAAANAAISAANRIGAAIKTNINQVGELEALAGKWNTRASLGVTSSGGKGTGEGNVKVKTPANMMTASEAATRKANNTVYNNNVKINTVNNNGNKVQTNKTKSVV